MSSENAPTISVDDDMPAPAAQATPSELVTERTTIGEWVWLLLCTAIGGFFRIVNLAGRPLWADELTTVITARRPLAESFTTSQDPQPPMYQLLVRLFSGGKLPAEDAALSETVMRMPAALFGIAIIPAVWWCARTFVGRVGAGVATLLIALNPLLIHHSRDARPYVLFVFFAVLSITFFYRLCKQGGKLNLAGYVIATVGLFLSHYYAMFIVAAQVVYAAADFLFGGPVRRRRWQVLSAFVLAGLGAAPILYLFVRLLTGGMKGSWWIGEPTGLIDSVDALGDLLGLRAFGVLCVIPLIAAFWLPGAPPILKRLGARLVKEGGTSKESKPSPQPSPRGRGGSSTSSVSYWSSWWFGKERAIFLALVIGFALFFPVFVSLVYKPGWVLRYSLPVVVPMVILGLMYVRACGPMVSAMVLVVLLGMTAPKAMKYRHGEPGLREAVMEMMNRKGVQESVVLVDWAFTDDFKLPEAVGVRMYGYTDPVQTVKVKELDAYVYRTPKDVGKARFDEIMANPDALLPREGSWIVCFRTTATAVREFLIRRQRMFNASTYGMYDDGRMPMYTLFHVAPR